MIDFNKDKVELQECKRRIYRLYKNHDYDEAFVEINDYLKKCPEDTSMLSMKAAVYRHNKDFDTALDTLESIHVHNKDSVLEMVRLYSCLERYEELLDLIELINSKYSLTDKESDQLKKISMAVLKHKYPAKFFRKYLMEYSKRSDMYFEKQMISYTAKDAIKYMQSNKRTAYAAFSDDFDLDVEVPNIRKELYKESKSNGTLFDEYYVYRPNCGYRDGIQCNYVKVYTIKGTKNIMKMLPVESSRVHRQRQDIVINYETYPNSKRNMIKRFYKRYNNT